MKNKFLIKVLFAFVFSVLLFWPFVMFLVSNNTETTQVIKNY